jgi:hypothetical protein
VLNGFVLVDDKHSGGVLSYQGLLLTSLVRYLPIAPDFRSLVGDDRVYLLAIERLELD